MKEQDRNDAFWMFGASHVLLQSVLSGAEQMAGCERSAPKGSGTKTTNNRDRSRGTFRR